MEQEKIIDIKERERIKMYDDICKKMTLNGYSFKKLTSASFITSIKEIAITIPLVLSFFVLFVLFNSLVNRNVDIHIKLFTFFCEFIVLVILYELVRVIVIAIVTKNHFKSIQFRINLKYIVPRCFCSELLKKWQYILTVAIPELIFGIVLAAISIVMGNITLLFLSTIMLFRGGGDYLTVLKIMKYGYKNGDVYFYEHPKDRKVVVFIKNKDTI